MKSRAKYKINGTPEKRIFLSIISDYDLQTGVCELVDNALDHWVFNGKKDGFKIDIILDYQRQLISVKDNAGGVKASDLRLLVSPGASGNKFNQEVIGIFGVGGKRAGVALGERVEIRTRYKNESTFRVDITSDWLQEDDWELTAYEIPDVDPGTTCVDISVLRQAFTEMDALRIKKHLGEVYSWFINEGCEIWFNEEPVEIVSFEHWSFPPDYLPRQASFEISPTGKDKIAVSIVAGLISDRDPEGENYGVYFYCNSRLVVKELRTRDVGYFVSGEAGVPHPDASLCRVIVNMQGPAELMPWNSSKSGINYSHPAFFQIRPTIIELVSYFSSLSRRLKSDWPGNVYRHGSGKIEAIAAEEILSDRKLVLPKLPRVRKLPLIDQIKANNKKLLADKPWTLGLVEAIGLVEVVFKQGLETKNRAALILLDSNFEIALKEFIVNRMDLFPPQNYGDAKIAQIFKARHQVVNEVCVHVSIPRDVLDKVNYYYNLRNKLIHERATVGITDGQVLDYLKVIEVVLKLLFGIKFPK